MATVVGLQLIPFEKSDRVFWLSYCTGTCNRILKKKNPKPRSAPCQIKKGLRFDGNNHLRIAYYLQMAISVIPDPKCIRVFDKSSYHGHLPSHRCLDLLHLSQACLVLLRGERRAPRLGSILHQSAPVADSDSFQALGVRAFAGKARFLQQLVGTLEEIQDDNWRRKSPLNSSHPRLMTNNILEDSVDPVGPMPSPVLGGGVDPVERQTGVTLYPAF